MLVGQRHAGLPSLGRKRPPVLAGGSSAKSELGLAALGGGDHAIWAPEVWMACSPGINFRQSACPGTADGDADHLDLHRH